MTTARAADVCALSLSKREPVPFDRLRRRLSKRERCPSTGQGAELRLPIAQPKRAALADPHVARPPRGLV